MIKKLILLAVALCVLPWSVTIAAEPVYHHYANATGDVTVDSQFTGSWKCLDSLILIVTDTSSVIISITGQVVMDPGDILYIGFGADSANRTSEASGVLNNNLDSALFKYPRSARSGKIQMPFCAQYIYTYASQTDLTDTIYFNAACIGSSSSEAVELKDVVVSVQVGGNTTWGL